AQGQYAFVNVPVGAYQVTVRQSGMKPKSSQVIVTVGASSTSQIQFAPADTLVSSHNSLLQAGAGTSLRGIVLDEEAHPLAGAKTLVTQSETGVWVVTAQDGTYELRNLKPGSYRVSAYKLRYKLATRAVALNPTSGARCDFQLSPLVSASINGLIRTVLVTQ